MVTLLDLLVKTGLPVLVTVVGGGCIEVPDATICGTSSAAAPILALADPTAARLAESAARLSYSSNTSSMMRRFFPGLSGTGDSEMSLRVTKREVMTLPGWVSS